MSTTNAVKNTQALNLLATYENIRAQLFALGDDCFFEYENEDNADCDVGLFMDAHTQLSCLESDFAYAVRALEQKLNVKAWELCN